MPNEKETKKEALDTARAEAKGIVQGIESDLKELAKSKAASTARDIIEDQFGRTDSGRVAWLSLVVAGLALSVTVWEGYENREHNRLSVAPRLTVTTRISASESGAAGIYVENEGLGPAIIRDVRVTIGNTTYQPADDGSPWAPAVNRLLEEAEPLDFNPEDDLHQFDFEENDTLGAGEAKPVFFPGPGKEKAQAWFEKNAGKISLEIDYESMYGESCAWPKARNC